jgi:hypothetical protein
MDAELTEGVVEGKAGDPGAHALAAHRLVNGVAHLGEVRPP